MKKITLSILGLLAFGYASAQDDSTGGKGFTSGDVFISGSVGISSEKEGDFKSNSFNIMPQVGFFVSDNIAIGGMVGYMSSKSEVSTMGVSFEEEANAFAIGAFGRYYATPASDFSFFGQLGFSYLTITEDDNAPGTTESKTNGFALAVSPGVSYFISSNFALEASIGALQYTTMKPDAPGAESTNNFDLELNLTNITFGLVYKF